MSYTFNDVMDFMVKHNIPKEVVKNLPDMTMSALNHRPTLDLYRFDDYLSKNYPNYENMSMEEAFNDIFGTDVEKAKYYFDV